MKHLSYLSLSLLLSPVVSMAQVNQIGSVRGVVKTSDSYYAQNLELRLDNKTVVTSSLGFFQMDKIPAGHHQMFIYAGSELLKTVDFDLAQGRVTDLGNIEIGVSRNTLDSIIVTAYKDNRQFSSETLRLNEKLIEVPQQITTIGSGTLNNQQIISMSDGVIRNIPGAMHLEHWGDSYTRINARGDRLAAFRNGMNITSSWGPLTEDMSFVDHIDVVRGPAGFMMSNGSPAGIYNVVTKKPTGADKEHVGVIVGSYDLYRATADVDRKIDSKGKFLYRLNVMGQKKRSIRHYEYNDRYSIAPTITYNLDNNTKINLEYIYQHAKMSNTGSYYVFSKEGYGKIPLASTMLDPNMTPTNINDHNVTLNIQHSFNENWKLTGQGSYFNYKKVGETLWADSVGNNYKVIRRETIGDALMTMKFGQLYLNGDFNTGAVHHKILTGVEIADKKYWGDWNQSLALDDKDHMFDETSGSNPPAVNGYPTFDRSKSIKDRAGNGGYIADQYKTAYFQDELGFFERKLRLTLAARYTNDKQVAYGTPKYANRWTPRIGLSYSITDDFVTYALYDQSFTPQSGVRRDGEHVKPLTGNNQEIGVKYNWANGRWGTSFDVYQILNNNQLTSDPSNNASESYVVQLGQTKTKGLEWEIHGQVFKGFNLMANYALTDAKITKYTDASQIRNRVAGSAKHVINSWASYTLADGALKGFGINAGWSFLGDRATWNWESNGTLNAKLPDYSSINAGLFWQNKKMKVNFGMFNVANRYLISGSSYSYLNAYYFQADPGRNFRFSVDYNF